MKSSIFFFFFLNDVYIGTMLTVSPKTEQSYSSIHLQSCSQNQVSIDGHCYFFFPLVADVVFSSCLPSQEY